ncbi:unnamed protein product [Umbelopsis vinacea]
MLRPVQKMCQLSKLLTSLPPLFLRQDWPTKLLTLLPLDTVLWRLLAPSPSIKAKWNLPVADIVHYYPDRRILLRRPKSEISNKRIIPYAKAWARSQIQPVPVFLHHIDLDLKRYHNSQDFNAENFPSLQHWTIRLSRLFSIKAICANPSNLRSFWRSKSFCTPKIPFTVGAKYSTLINKKQWDNFWKAEIPHNARTPWWRLLHDKIPYRIRLHRRQPDKVDSALCGICKNVPEDDFHLFVGCTLKWSVWQKALRELSRQHSNY